MNTCRVHSICVDLYQDLVDLVRIDTGVRSIVSTEHSPAVYSMRVNSVVLGFLVFGEPVQLRQVSEQKAESWDWFTKCTGDGLLVGSS
jgi:hypothetical protein